MHIRHGDKMTQFWETMDSHIPFYNRTLDDYQRFAKDLVRLKHPSRDPDANIKVLFMTDDKDVVDSAPAAARNVGGVEVFTVPTGRPLISSSAVRKSSVGSKNHEQATDTKIKFHA